MEKIEVKLRLLSPAFLAGANQQDVELRSASIKGLLRWWWRAACADTTLTPDKLLRQEGALFGTAGKAASSKAPISCEVWFDDQPFTVVTRGSAAPQSGVTYTWRKGGKQGDADALLYLSYAVIRIPTKEEKAKAEKGGDPDLWDPKTKQPKKYPLYTRRALAEGTRFTLRLSWLPGRVSEQQKKELYRALAAWIVLGGLGSRSRKGFGALGLASQEPPELASFLRELHAKLQSPSSLDLPQQLPPWPSLKYLRVLGSFSAQNWRDALGKAGFAYRAIRPKGGSAWIAGQADPRRASSVFVTLTEDQGGGLHSWIYALPCRRSSTSDLARDHEEWKNFLQLAAKQMASISP